MIITTLSTKNQITLPKLILEALGIKNGDKLLVQAQNEEIKIKPMGRSIVDSLAKSIKISPEKKNIPFKKVLLSTQKAVAKKLATQ